MKKPLLFLQLPSLDNDVKGPRENIPLAATYLRCALERSSESRHFTPVALPPECDDWDNATLVQSIVALRPAVIACTLYLWNIERTLRLLREVRKALPGVRVAVGGPDVAREHPFLLRSRVPDAVAVGEGEAVFPAILKAFRDGSLPDYTTVALRQGRRYAWGRRTPPPVRLAESLPPVEALRPDARGMGYLETTRGCPLRCAFCRYHHLRHGVEALAPAEVARRAMALERHGAREVKFVDPTFNSHPQFLRVLRCLANANANRHLSFYAELRAETIDDEAADLLAKANFTEIEVGMQSRDPAVLRAIRRPTDLAALEAGARRLTRRGIRVTLDVLYGLPQQRAADVYRSVRWARRLRRVRVQCMQTLLLPGTDLRARAQEWKMVAPALPPYGVIETETMPRAAVRRIEEFIGVTPGLPADAPTARFVGTHLPDLFRERCRIALPVTNRLAIVTTRLIHGAERLPPATLRVAMRAGRVPAGARRRAAPSACRVNSETTDTAGALLPGTSNRRALILSGANLFAHTAEICGIVRRAVRAEPDMLWQFVLRPAAEEPLDLLDALAAELQSHRPHLLDRYAGPSLSGRMVARRVMVQLRRGVRYDAGWVRSATELLQSRFY